AARVEISLPASSAVYALHQDYLLITVDFAELDFDNFAVSGLDGAADEGGFDWQFAVAAVDEREQLHAARASVIEERVEGGADGASGVEHVVDQDDVASGDIEADGTGNHGGARAVGGKIVAIEADIEHAGV